MKKAFKLLDVDGDEYISRDDLLEASSSLSLILRRKRYSADCLDQRRHLFFTSACRVHTGADGGRHVLDAGS